MIQKEIMQIGWMMVNHPDYQRWDSLPSAAVSQTSHSRVDVAPGSLHLLLARAT
jgi:hypothetical protein